MAQTAESLIKCPEVEDIMARFSDQDLVELKSRVITAMGSNTNIGNASTYILELIAEVQELRQPVVPAPVQAMSSKGKLIVGEMEVRKVGLPEPVIGVGLTPEKSVEDYQEKASAQAEEAPAPLPPPQAEEGAPVPPPTGKESKRDRKKR